MKKNINKISKINIVQPRELTTEVEVEPKFSGSGV